MTRLAHSFVLQLDPEPVRELRVSQHYLLCVSRGVLRLESAGTRWSLPPARAALIEAANPIRVTVPQASTTSSVLFEIGFVPAPAEPLVVFDLSPLARALINECRAWGPSPEPLPDYATAMFRALAEVTWRLAQQPSPASAPVATSDALHRVLALMEERLETSLRFGDIAAELGWSTRALARRFDDELGMTWRAALRRLRLLRAIEGLAETDAPITEIAFSVGYASLSAFNSAFRDLMGRTPSDYRSSFRS